MTGGLAAVTGASGFIGSHLVEALIAARQPTRAITRATSDRRWLPTEIESATAALDDDAALGRAIRGASVVFHLAAVTSSPSDADYTRVNVDGTRRVLEVVRRCAPDARVVICSSLAAIGPARDERALIEEDSPRPVSAYGQSKLAAEHVADSFAAEHGIDIVLVRPGAVYGPRDRDILAAFKLASRGLALRVSSERQRLAMIHVRDLVAALLLAADRGRAAPGGARRYHVSDGFAHRWSAVNDAIAKAVGRRVRVVAVPRAAAVAMALAQSFVARVTGSKPLLTPDRIAELSAADWSCDISRARRELGFEPRVSLAGGMRETAQWYWEQGWL